MTIYKAIVYVSESIDRDGNLSSHSCLLTNYFTSYEHLLAHLEAVELKHGDYDLSLLLTARDEQDSAYEDLSWKIISSDSEEFRKLTTEARQRADITRKEREAREQATLERKNREERARRINDLEAQLQRLKATPL
jgi:hypothetical protein